VEALSSNRPPYTIDIEIGAPKEVKSSKKKTLYKLLLYNISKKDVGGQYRLVTRPEAEHMAPMAVTLHGNVALV